MAAADEPSSDSASALGQMIAEQQAVVAQAIAQLALLEVTVALDPSAAGLAAEKSQQANVTVQEALLANLDAEQKATTPPPTTGPGSPGYGVVTTGPVGPQGPISGITNGGLVSVTGVVVGGTAAVESGWDAALGDLDSMAGLSSWFDSIGGSALEAGASPRWPRSVGDS